MVSEAQRLALVGQSSVAQTMDHVSNESYVLVEERVWEQLR
jgi:hypothetical protein